MKLGEPQNIFFADQDAQGKALSVSYSFFQDSKINLVICASGIGVKYHGVVDHILRNYCKGVNFEDINIYSIYKNGDGSLGVSKYLLIPNLVFFSKYQMPRTFFQKLFNSYVDPSSVRLHPSELVIGHVQSAIEIDESFISSGLMIERINNCSGFLVK